MKWRFMFRSNKKSTEKNTPSKKNTPDYEDYYSEIIPPGQINRQTSLQRSDSTPCFPMQQSMTGSFQSTRESAPQGYQHGLSPLARYTPLPFGMSHSMSTSVISSRTNSSLPYPPDTLTPRQQQSHESTIQPYQYHNISRYNTQSYSQNLPPTYASQQDISERKRQQSLQQHPSACPPCDLFPLGFTAVGGLLNNNSASLSSVPTSTSANSPVVAFCPNCHTLVHPIPRRRPQIRTNPWMSNGRSNPGTAKSPGDVPISPCSAQSHQLAITPITDSGISDLLGQSDTSSMSGIKQQNNFYAKQNNIPSFQYRSPEEFETSHVTSQMGNISINTQQQSSRSLKDDSSTSCPTIIDQNQTENKVQQNDHQKQQRRKKKKHRRKKSADHAETERKHSVGSNVPKNSCNNESTSYSAVSRSIQSTENLDTSHLERQHNSTSNLYHEYDPHNSSANDFNIMSTSINLTSRPLPRVHEDEILTSSPNKCLPQDNLPQRSRSRRMQSFSSNQQPLSASNHQSSSATNLIIINNNEKEIIELRQQMRRKIDKLISDKLILEQNLSQAQREWHQHRRQQFDRMTARSRGNYQQEDSEEEMRSCRAKEEQLTSLSVAYERLSHQMHILETSWQSLLDPQTIGSVEEDQEGAYYSSLFDDTHSSQSRISTLPRHL